MVFENLTVKLFPGETIEMRRNPAVLTDAMKATVVDFYCSDIVSVISPSMKDKDIIRLYTAKGYMMYTLSEAFETFSVQHPKAKISSSTF